jgi:hypothetical protein
MSDTPVRRLDRAGIHAMIDIAIDQAEADLSKAGGFGISMQGANGPNFSCMFVAGNHSRLSPRQIVAKALEFSGVMASFSTHVEHRKGLNNEETRVKMAEKLSPPPPSTN